MTVTEESSYTTQTANVLNEAMEQHQNTVIVGESHVRTRTKKDGDDDGDTNNNNDHDARQPQNVVANANAGESDDMIANDAHNSDDDNANNSGESSDASKIVATSEILYGVDSFYAIVQPVLITMILSSLAVTCFNTPESRAAGEAAVASAYNVNGNAEDAGSTSQQLSAGLVNALVIVCVVCGMAFVLVLLYRFRCMKIILGYMIIASMMLLGFLSSAMFQVAVEKYELGIDKISFWLFIYNFGVVGTLSIYYPLGIPAYITQAYLILTSVIVAWQLSYFDPWTAWCLLIMLALYDLFAVLTPCGPLKALLKLMSKENAPEMPGLLYEASLPNNTGRRHTRNSQNDSADATSESQRNSNPDDHQTDTPATGNSTTIPNNVRDEAQGDESDSSERATSSENQYDSQDRISADDEHRKVPGENRETIAPISSFVCMKESSQCVEAVVSTDEVPRPTASIQTQPQREAEGIEMTNLVSEQQQQQVPSPGDEEDNRPAVVTSRIPLAIAKVYRLPLVENLRQERSIEVEQHRHRGNNGSDVAEDTDTFTSEELKEIVEVVFPRAGGIIRARIEQREGEETRYDVIDRQGNLRRTLFVNAEGRVFNDLREQNAAAAAAEAKKERNNIRLGLGDFIFYSILVCQAAVYSFTTFAACTLVILIGLGLTLALLSFYGKALPALPISIFLGVIFYLLTRYLLQPWIQEIFLQQCYV